MNTSWSTLKKTLADRGKLHPTFLTVVSVNSDRLKVNKFEPLLISRYADKLADLIEKCLTLKREIQELEILAVKAAVDYDLFVVTSAIDEESETLKLYDDAKAVKIKWENNAAATFGDTSPLNSGFKAVSQGTSESTSAEVATDHRLAELIKKRWSSVRAYQAAYHSRYNEPGNAHNYAQRADNLKRILQSELEEAAQRAIALNSGLKTVYAWTPGQLPGSFDASTLDDFAVWVLEARRELAHRTEGESLFDLVVPLVQPWLQNGVGLIAKDAFDKALGTPTDKPVVLPFEITRDLFLGQDVRLKGVGLAFGNKFKPVIGSGIDAAETSGRFARLSAALISPKQVASDGSEGQRPTVILGNVGLHQSGIPDAYYDDVAVENISPFGKWEIHLHPWIVWKNGDVNKLSDGVGEEPILDLKLTFRAYSPAR